MRIAFCKYRRSQPVRAYMKMQHDPLAEVNVRWGLERGYPVSVTGARHLTTEQYRRKVYEENSRLEQCNKELEQKIAEKTVTLNDIMTQISSGHKAVKGLTTMINNLNAEKKYVEYQLVTLRETKATTDAEQPELELQIAEKEIPLSKICDGLADKTAKLEKAQKYLEELERLTSDAEFRHNMMQRSLQESSLSMKKIRSVPCSHRSGSRK